MRSSFVTLGFYILLQWIFPSKIFALRGPGVTSPERVEIAIGGSANITCRMNLPMFSGKNSSTLYFYSEMSRQNVSMSDIAIVNASSIVYMMHDAPTQNSEYVCKSEGNGIAITKVFVGTIPSQINDFQCRGYDFTYMVCNFTIPKNNVMTTYSLNYTAQSPYEQYYTSKNGTRHHRTIYSQNYVQNCELDIQESHGICNLTLDKNNYRANYKFYNFSLMGQNSLGTKKQHFWINHDESVVPPRPDLHIAQLTDSSVVLTWNWVRYSYYEGLDFEVYIRSNDFDWMEYKNYTRTRHNSEFKLKLFNLPYAFYSYTVRLRIRVKSTRVDDTMWSEPSIFTFQTKSRLPKSPPTTDVGSFYMDSTETNITLYWKQIPVYDQNGANFKYIIKRVQQDGIDVTMLPLRIDKTSATFTWHKNHTYKFTIKSKNDEGESVENATITVHPIRKYKLLSPNWIRNVYNEPKRTYSLSWSPPINQTDLLDYTVFWCQSKNAMSSDCEGTINFEHVGKDTTNYVTAPYKQDQQINLAISANYIDYNSGMHWTMCATQGSGELEKLDPEMIATSGNTIKVQWYIQNVCPSLLEGYNLTYCKVKDRGHVECLDEIKTVTIDKTAKKYNLTNLEPFTSYKLQIYMFSSKPGKNSDPIIVQTFEEAPTPPRNLQVYNITSNSAWISWMPPFLINGDLRYYTIIQNNEHHILNCTTETNNCTNDITKELHFELKNLASYTDYKVYVIAHNILEQSAPSNDRHFKTLIGIPSYPHHIIIPIHNRTVLQWSPPDVPSGRVEFYEVAVIVWYKNEIRRERISGVVGATSCTVDIPVCIDTDYKHTLEVRAVNVALRESEVDHQVFMLNNTNDDSDAIYYNGNDDLKCIGTAYSDEKQMAIVQRYRNNLKYKQYKSVWEKGPIYGCAASDQTQQSKITSIALLVVVMALGVMAVFYFGRNKYNTMSKIGCTLPPGLDSMTFPSKGGVDNLNIDKEDEEYHRSKESLFNNEEHHLLSSICNDSGYLGGIHNTKVCSIGKSSGYIGSDQSDMGYTQNMLQHSLKSEESPAAAYMVMEALKPNVNVDTKSQSVQMPTNDGYIKPSSEDSFIGLKSKLPLIPSNNGYIKPSKMMNWHTGATVPAAAGMQNKPMTQAGSIPVSSSGYVQPQMLQKQMAQPLFDGYTSLDALGKPPLGSDTIQTITSPQAFGRVPSVPPPISGYVTQKELSAYGQHEMS